MRKTPPAVSARKMAVTRTLAERRALARIDSRFRRSDPRLAAMFAVFNYSHRHERGPDTERLSAWRPALSRVPAIALALAGLVLIVLGMIFLAQTSQRLYAAPAAMPAFLLGQARPSRCPSKIPDVQTIVVCDRYGMSRYGSAGMEV